MSAVAILRRAASVLREQVGQEETGIVIPRAVPLARRDIALALADWLDDEAARGLGKPDNVAAYAVARAVLREAGE